MRTEDRPVDASPSLGCPAGAEHDRGLTEFGSGLMGQKLEFWYDQFLGKPPGKSVPTEWHQDEGYWGRNLADRGITGWIPLQDVDATNGCMHFIDEGHRLGVLVEADPELAALRDLRERGVGRGGVGPVGQ